MVSVILEEGAAPSGSGRGLLTLLRVGWRAGEGLTKKARCHWTGYGGRTAFLQGERAGQQQQQQHGYHW